MTKIAVIHSANDVEREPNQLRLRASGNKVRKRYVETRAHLADVLYDDIANAWLQHGPRALERLIANDPATFMKVCIALLPKSPGQTDDHRQQRTSAEIDAELLRLIGKTN